MSRYMLRMFPVVEEFDDRDVRQMPNAVSLTLLYRSIVYIIQM